MSNFYVNPVVGVRTWRMEPDKRLLKALVFDEVWPPHRPLISTHASPFLTPAWAAHRPPITTNTPTFQMPSFTTHTLIPTNCEPGHPCERCGIWAFNNYASVERHRQESAGSVVCDLSNAVEVRGLVAGWGTVHLATQGWRAGRAYPLALFEWAVSPHQIHDGPFWHRIMHAIAENYGIPVIRADEIAELLTSTGVVLPADLGGGS